MDIAALKSKIEEYSARELELAARLGAAASDKQRFEIERMRRLVQVALSEFLISATEELARDRSGHSADAAIRRQATA